MDGNGNIVAAQIEREEPGRYRVAWTGRCATYHWRQSGGYRLHIRYRNINGWFNTEFEDASEASIDGVDFFSNVSDGDLIAFEDELPANGVADEVEFED